MPGWTQFERELRRELWDQRIVASYPQRPASLAALIDDAASGAGDREVQICGDLRLAGGQLADHVNSLAAGLPSRGIVQGDRVVLLLGNCASFIMLVLAAWRLGAVIVPVSPREQLVGVEHVLRESEATALFYGEELVGAVPPAGAPMRPAHRLAVESAAFEALFLAGGEPSGAPSEEDPVAILYTSGTTGRPKGAVLSHRNVIHSALNYVLTMGPGPDDRTLIAVPMSHVTGLVALIATAALARGAMIVMRSLDARRFLDLVEREKMAHTVLVPAMFNLCLLQDDLAERDLSIWRIAGYGGAPMTRSTIARRSEVLPGLQLMNIYGATETTSPAVIMPPEHALQHCDAVGLPAPGAQVLVMDEGREAEAGTVGELWISGPIVVSGYWRNPHATGTEFSGGFWRSGDLGEIDADGFVRVHDRLKDMINHGGYKIYSAEVESFLSALEGVVEAAVVARPCAVLGERVHAIVVVRSATEAPSAELLRAGAATHLAAYKVPPKAWTVTTEPLPRNANGKVLKRDLRDELAAYVHESGGAARA